MDLMKEFPDNHFDLAICDPPYFSGPERRKFYGSSTGKSKHSITGVNQVVNRVEYPVTDKWEVPGSGYFEELRRVSKNQIIWGVNYFINNQYAAGRIVWDKVNGESSFSDCELALCTFHDSVRKFEFMWNGMMQGESVHSGSKQQGNKKLNEKKIHPTQKPVKLYEWLLESYANEGDKILDTHLGSGSIAIACHYKGFNLTACDLSEVHFKNACERIENETRQLTLF